MEPDRLGADALDRMVDWRVVVEDVFHIADRPRPIVVGEIARGVVYNDDWFLVNGGRLGRVLTVELVCGPDVREGSISFTADVEIKSGDVLTGIEPMAA